MFGAHPLLFAGYDLVTPSLTYIGSHESGTDASSYTFSSASLGDPHPNRIICVSVSTRQSGSPAAISSVTIGGVTATEQVWQRSVDTSDTGCGLYTAAVPTGTTGDIVVTMSTTYSRCGVGVWRMTNVSATAVDTCQTPNDNFAENLTFTGTVQVIAASYGFSASRNATWTAPTEDFEAHIESGLDHSGASAANQSSSPYSVQVDWSGTDKAPTVGACFQ